MCFLGAVQRLVITQLGADWFFLLHACSLLGKTIETQFIVHSNLATNVLGWHFFNLVVSRHVADMLLQVVKYPVEVLFMLRFLCW